jgi:hypothetical protein
MLTGKGLLIWCESSYLSIDSALTAFQVSSKSHPHLHIQRTAKECEIRWLGDRHPEFNHSTWQAKEIADCRALVAESTPGTVDWVNVANKLGASPVFLHQKLALTWISQTHRTPLDCMRHGIVRRTHVWTPEFDEKLLDAVEIYGTNNWLIGQCLFLGGSIIDCFVLLQLHELYRQMRQLSNVKIDINVHLILILNVVHGHPQKTRS